MKKISGPGAAGKGTKEDGYLAYYEICEAVQEEEGWGVQTPYPGVMGPYAHKDKLWVGFDDEVSLKIARNAQTILIILILVLK